MASWQVICGGRSSLGMLLFLNRCSYFIALHERGFSPRLAFQYFFTVLKWSILTNKQFREMKEMKLYTAARRLPLKFGHTDSHNVGWIIFTVGNVVGRQYRPRYRPTLGQYWVAPYRPSVGRYDRSILSADDTTYSKMNHHTEGNWT